MKRQLIFQAFNWKISDIENNLSKIASQGFTMIQTSPLQGTKQNEGPWWIYYQPVNFNIGNPLGTKEDLIRLCKAADKFNIGIVVDVVCNHVANKNGEDGKFIPHDSVDPKIKDNPFFFKEKRSVENWNDRWQVTHWCISLPGLDTSNYDFQDIVCDYLNELVDCGVKGFRFDAAKHIALPEDYNDCDFWPRVLNKLKRDDLFIYGEVILTSKEIIDRYTKYINVGTDGYGSDRRKLIIWPFSHDEDLTYGMTKHITSEIIINEWTNLLRNNKESHILFYPRQFDDTWMSEKIRKINLMG